MLDVSIHTPRVGRDFLAPVHGLEDDVSIHTPRVGRDDCRRLRISSMPVFQSTRPVWGATRTVQMQGLTALVSIHTPRVGRD